MVLIQIFAFCIILLIQQTSSLIASESITDVNVTWMSANIKGKNIYFHTTVTESSRKNDVAALGFKFQKIGFRSNGCTCQDLSCGCCFGMNVTQFNFNREGCLQFSYDPYEFALLMDVLWENSPIFHTGISGKNPPPICFPAPIPYIPNVDFCVKLFNIHTPGQNIHVCVDLEARIQRVPILVLHFDCMKLGTDGVSVVKPENRL